MRRLLSGLLVASCSLPLTCSDDAVGAGAVGEPGDVGASSSLSHDAPAAEALHSVKNKRSIESVASTIRRAAAAANSARGTLEYDFDHARRKEDEHRKRQQQRQRKQQQANAERDLIVGGSAAPPGRFPYVVSLQLEKVLDATSPEYADTENGVSDVHTCGGTLIAMDVVLTAGHCGYEELPSSSSASITSGSNQPGSGEPGHVNFGDMPQQIFYGADVGAYNLTSNDGGGYTVDNMLFEKLVIHPDYTGFHGKGNNRMSLQHDVMLVKLYGAADQPVVRLHDPSKSGEWLHREPVAGDDLVVTGWGDTDPLSGEAKTSLASVLHAATVHYVPNDVCEKSKGYSSIQAAAGGTIESNKFEDYFEYDGTISDDMMCALGESKQDACQGDSGGGLLRLGSDYNGAEDVQMGIVSWGLQCGDEDFPGVYSRVGDHYNWIAEKVCEISDSPPSYFNCPTKPYPPGSPYDTVVDLTITIRFDNFRRETGWILESVPDFRNVVFRPFGTYTPKTTVDENNAMSETIPVHSGRFYMLSILDEFADGLCCTVGEGYFRVDSSAEKYPIVDRTLGIMWTPHALRRMFYVSPPAPDPNPPDYVSVVVTLGIGADPGDLLLVALENTLYEAMMMYEIQPFVIMNDSRAGTMTTVYSRTFRVPVFGKEYGRQKYNVMVYDDSNGGVSKASFEVYLGDVNSGQLLLSENGSNYGENENDVSRSFVLNKKIKTDEKETSDYLDDADSVDWVTKSAASVNSSRGVIRCLLLVVVLSSCLYIIQQ